METINHECYISLEVAKLLKEAGFDWECPNMYLFTVRGHEIHGMYKGWMPSEKDMWCPTLDVAQRWLREVKGIEFDLCWHLTLDNQYKYAYAIKIKSIWKGLDKGKEIEVPSMNCLEAETCFNTFEKAQEAGIKKALELILKKGE